MAISFSIRVLDRLVVESGLAMAGKVLEMRLNDGCPLFCDSCHHGLFIVRHGLPLDYRYRTFGTGADAGAKTVAEEVADKAGLALDQPERPFRAVRDALAAARAFFLIDTDDLPFHGRSPALDII